MNYKSTFDLNNAMVAWPTNAQTTPIPPNIHPNNTPIITLDDPVIAMCPTSADNVLTRHYADSIKEKETEQQVITRLMNEGVLVSHGGLVGGKYVHKYWTAPCIVCGAHIDILCDPTEFDPESHYCGRGPSCCP